MTPSEVKVFIAESNHSDFFKTNAAKFDFSYIGFKNTYTGLSSIYEFVNNQDSAWDKIDIKLPPELQESKRYFKDLKTKIEKYISIQDTNQLRNEWNSILNHISNSVNYFPFTYNCPELQFLLHVHTHYPISLSAAFKFIVKHPNSGNNFNDRNSIIGIMLAYEFTLKDNSKIVERRNAEKSSLGKLRNDFEKYISESEIQLSDHLSKAKNKFDEYSQAIDSIKVEKEKLFSDWHEKVSTDFTKFNSDSQSNIIQLNNTYEELLRLKKPAEYWKLRAAELKKEGWKSLHWLIALIVLSVALLFSLLWLTPEDMLLTFFDENKGKAVRWSIIFITLISFLAYGIKTLNKVTFSSFHLARDAEERERLTFVYLAMIKDASIDKEDRHLIMQSLFSRADTGLLKEDSAPTMPGISSIIGSK